MKTIPIEDWYAPGFPVRIRPTKCGAHQPGRRRLSRSRMFQIAHRGPCGIRPTGRTLLASRIALTNHE